MTSWSPKGGSCNSAAAPEAERHSKQGGSSRHHVARATSPASLEFPSDPGSAGGLGTNPLNKPCVSQLPWGWGCSEGGSNGRSTKRSPSPQLFLTDLLNSDLHGNSPDIHQRMSGDTNVTHPYNGILSSPKKRRTIARYSMVFLST